MPELENDKFFNRHHHHPMASELKLKTKPKKYITLGHQNHGHQLLVLLDWI